MSSPKRFHLHWAPGVVGALAVELGRLVIGRAVKAGEAVGGAGVCRAGFGGGRG